jgi:3-dehydroquinate dehydratase-2
MKKNLVLNGINLNMFGVRDASQYGTISLNEIDSQCVTWASELGYEVEYHQTNHEGEMASRIH